MTFNYRKDPIFESDVRIMLEALGQTCAYKQLREHSPLPEAIILAMMGERPIRKTYAVWWTSKCKDRTTDHAQSPITGSRISCADREDAELIAHFLKDRYPSAEFSVRTVP